MKVGDNIVAKRKHGIFAALGHGAALVALLVALPLAAQSDGDEEDGQTALFADETVRLPAFPEQDNLQRVSVDSAGAPFVYYVDMASLSLHAGGVVRYTVVIVSNSGARNIMYEGIRCPTREVRTYAFGSGERFVAARNDEWFKFYRDSSMPHRYDFYRNFFCNVGQNDSRREADIRRRLKYSEDFVTSGD